MKVLSIQAMARNKEPFFSKAATLNPHYPHDFVLKWQTANYASQSLILIKSVKQLF